MLQFPLYLGHSRCISLQDWGAAPYHQSRKSHQYTWLLPSNLPRKDQLVSRDLHAGTTQPPSAHHSLHSLSQPLKGQVCHPTLAAGTAWALSPHLSPFFFLLKRCLLFWCPWACRDSELLELNVLGGFPL